MNIKNRTILITGGTGSFGCTVARHLLRLQPAEIRIFSRDEKKQWEMGNRFPQFRYLLGDVRDSARVDEVMDGVDIVFHAAALKQVPACEAHPCEAVKTNILGSSNVCAAATEHGVGVFVGLSTDKAVKPVNAMGISKAMLEKIVCSRNTYERGTIFCCVRYGNVMGSRGSVIPLFRKQIAENVPLTITSPLMTRFLMTLDQSVDLVLHAIENAKGGEIFVRKAPSCTVQDLAEAVRKKYSHLKGDHPMQQVGVRPGEKLHEVLINEYEMQRVTEEQNYFVVHPDYNKPQKLTEKPLGSEYTSENTEQVSDPEHIGKMLDAMGEGESYS